MGGLFSKPATNTTTFNGLQIQTAVFGQPIPLIYGTTRLSGNIIDYIDFTQTSSGGGGGKGGGGKGGSGYSYSVAVAIGLCQGPINGIGRVWGGNSNTVIGQYNPSWSIDSNTSNVINAQNYDDTGAALSVETDLTVFWGTLSQSPWTYMLSNHPERALNYPLLTYLAGYISLGDSNTVPDYSFEVFGSFIFGNGILDCNPALPLYDALTNPVGGAFYPTQYVADMTNFSNYCIASGIFISPQITDSKATSDFVNEVMQCTNSQPVVSQGLLYFCPYGTDTVSGNGATYTPNLEPIYTLNDDDYLYADNDDPVKLTRESTIDAYNFLKVNFLNRADYYNDDIAIAEDQAAVDRYGVRPADSISLPHICDAGVAQIAANNLLYRIVYPRNTYAFKTAYFPFCLLDPMDLIEINDTNLGLVNQLVRVISCDPDEQKEISFTVEEVGIVANGAVEYPRQSAVRSSVNYAADPGNINPPLIFEPPDAVAGGLAVWIGASGGKNWGSCTVWVSDDGNTYKSIGQVTNPARQGLLATQLPVDTDPDLGDITIINGGDAFSTPDTIISGGDAFTTITDYATIYDGGSVNNAGVAVTVDLSESSGELSSGTTNDADNYNTLCYADGELISYATATLKSKNVYDLSYLRRGAYGTTIANHNATSQFCRIDEAIFRYPFTADKIGKTIYLKFTSLNVYGSGEQSIADVEAYSYQIKGSALYTPLPDLQNLQLTYQNGNAILVWSPVVDFRSPILYEIRKGGSSWIAAQVIGRISGTSYQVTDDDIYWISAVYISVYNGVSTPVYSDTPSMVEIGGARIYQNVVATFDEAATNWQGTLGDGTVIRDNALTLGYTGLIDDVASIDALSSIDTLGGTAATQGSYTIPPNHVIDLGISELCTVSCAYHAAASNINESFDQVADVDQLADWDGSYLQYINVGIQINVANADGTYSGWQDFIAGQYFGRMFNLRMNISTQDPQIVPLISEFSFTIDMPDKSDTGNILLVENGQSVLYNSQFHMIPNPVITILNAVDSDKVLLTNQTESGFAVQITNNGVGVSRSINWIAQGY